MTVFHIALLEFKATVSAADLSSLFSECLSLKDNCLHPDTKKPYMKSMAAGKEISIEGLNGGFSHAFVCEFDSTADRDYYLKSDPVHKAYATKIGQFWAKGYGRYRARKVLRKGIS